MGWITRYNQFYNLISNGVIPAANKSTLQLLNKETIRRHTMINYWNNVQVAPLAIVSDYNSVYQTFQTVMTAALADITTDYVIPDVSNYVDLLERLTFSEGYILFLASKGELAYTHLRILTSLSEIPASGVTNEVAMYLGGLYVYTTSWQRQIAKGYKGSLNSFPTGADGNFYIFQETVAYKEQALYINGEQLEVNGEQLVLDYKKKQSIVHTSGLYINGEQISINGEALEVSRKVIDACIWFFDTEWKPDYDTASWRYAAAVEEYNDITDDYPDVVDNKKAIAKKSLQARIKNINNNLWNCNRGIEAQTAINIQVAGITNLASGNVDSLEADFTTIKDGLEYIIDKISNYIPEEETDD